MNLAIHFTDVEIELARELRALRLPWTPMPGHFVFDESGLVERESPFQKGVYFVLNYEYFMEIAGGEERFCEIMLWLPTWEQCRDSLRDLGIDDGRVAQFLADHDGWASGQERTLLYKLMIQELRETRNSE